MIPSYSQHCRANAVRFTVLQGRSGTAIGVNCGRLKRRPHTVSVRAETGGLGGFFKKDDSKEVSES